MRTFVTLLKSHNQVELKTTNVCTILKLCNYDTYNTIQPTDQPADNQRITSGQPADGQKYNKGNKIISERSVVPPTFEMVAKYCTERKNGIDPNYFIDWYTARGWMIGKDKMKDWQAAIRTWEKKDNQSSYKQQSQPYQAPIQMLPDR